MNQLKKLQSLSYQAFPIIYIMPGATQLAAAREDKVDSEREVKVLAVPSSSASSFTCAEKGGIIVEINHEQHDFALL